MNKLVRREHDLTCEILLHLIEKERREKRATKSPRKNHESGETSRYISPATRDRHEAERVYGAQHQEKFVKKRE